ncbi:MAG: hypothetical protein MI864_12375 [Pseudomonadales bacterium]|uniref:Uncharacterized protein n=1 Tax=Oleiphilus messinensis TaxID=141451 RepID=A0A1Y0I827_9GAMM|nr:hypothetical protein [Oleiphilus messinensis]ARU55645.1 hypothetical protein OLMES_1570 [Oleiphilus messinensis]MCG8611321.1 hypothetical protein [Pseudomonadales bacterium]
MKRKQSSRHADFISDLITDKQPMNVIQVGMGNNIMTTAVCLALTQIEEGLLTIVSPPLSATEEQPIHQLDSLRKEKLETSNWPVELVEVAPEKVLPDLYFQSRTMDFAIINEQRRFDEAMIAFYYIDMMMPPGGTIIITSADRPVMRKLCRYMALERRYPCSPPQLEKKAGLFLRKMLKDRLDKAPAKFRNRVREFVNPDLLVTNEDLGIEGDLIIFTKPGDHISKREDMEYEAQLNMDFDSLLESIMQEDETQP